MQPFKRRRRTRRDMIVLGGWLFADLLLGLAMIFLVANTVGSEPPTPTPTAEPDWLATATAEFAIDQSNSDSTIEALEDEQVRISVFATEEAIAAQTQAAMTEDEQATFAANSTEQAITAKGTIDAISTEQAEQQSDSQSAAEEQATLQAEATEIAISIDAQSTEQAELAAVATENAESGVTTQATNEALQDELESNTSAMETAEAEAQNNADALATTESNATSIEATNEALISSQSNVEATISALEEEARASTLNPTAITETLNVDVAGVLSGDEEATRNAVQELHSVLDKYANGTNCKLGFINISTTHPEVSTGSQNSDRIGELIQQEFPDLLLQEGGELAYFPFADIGQENIGQVELLIFTNVGCQPAG